MTRIERLALIFMLLMLSVFLGSATYVLWDIDHNSGAAISAGVNKSMSAEFATINADIAQPTAALTADLGEAHKLIYTANVTALESGKAAMLERRMLMDLNPKILASVNDLDTTVKQAGTALEGIKANDDTLTTATATELQKIGPVLDNLSGTMVTTQKTIADVDSRVNSPQIQKFLDESTGTMAELHATAKNVNETSADTQQTVHTFSCIVSLGIPKRCRHK